MNSISIWNNKNILLLGLKHELTTSIVEMWSVLYKKKGSFLSFLVFVHLLQFGPYSKIKKLIRKHGSICNVRRRKSEYYGERLFRMNTIEDEKIIELFWERSEDAVRQTEAKYGRYLLTVAGNILSDEQDCQECVNDVLLAAWNAIPPARPQVLKLFLARVTRNIAVSKWRSLTAGKRGSGQAELVLDEIREMSSGRDIADEVADNMVLSQAISSFLRSKSRMERIVFTKRYWLFMTTREIAESVGLSESNVKVMLHRMRKELRKLLIKEGFEL